MRFCCPQRYIDISMQNCNSKLYNSYKTLILMFCACSLQIIQLMKFRPFNQTLVAPRAYLSCVARMFFENMIRNIVEPELVYQKVKFIRSLVDIHVLL